MASKPDVLAGRAGDDGEGGTGGANAYLPPNLISHVQRQSQEAALELDAKKNRDSQEEGEYRADGTRQDAAARPDRAAKQQQQQQSASSGTQQVGQRVSSTTHTYRMGLVLGNGSFGVVSEAVCLGTGEKVAVKRVLQDPRYKNRELDVMKQLVHPNIVTLKDYFYTEVAADAKGHDHEPQRYLSVVMEFVPETVYKVLKSFTKNNCYMPVILVKLYSYQMLRAIGYLHSLGICHRDIKPQNLLVDVKTHQLKLCDFGSAKRLLKTEGSVSYICSRFYRAPELMMGATQYTCAIDTWSMGCVLAELLTGWPLFAGDTSIDQLVRIIRVLGAPTQEQVVAMSPKFATFKFPYLRARDFKSFFALRNQENRIPEAAFDLLKGLLKYVPHERLLPYDALSHPFYDQLREPNVLLPGGTELPELFNFSQHELDQMKPANRARSIPYWYASSPPSAASLVSPPTLDADAGAPGGVSATTADSAPYRNFPS